MKQVLQSARTGELQIAEIPAPFAAPGCVLVKVAASLVSAGTERASAEFASKSLFQKARARPDLFRQVVNKARRDGICAAAATVRSRLDQPSPLGYSCAGTVIEVGSGIDHLMPGERVACAGANFAVHAEFASVPRMLVARIPSADVSWDEAAFTTLGAVAIHAVRTAEAKLGEIVAVIGLGLMGQLAVQILCAAGCKVIGIDPVLERAALAAKMGAAAATTSEEEFRDLVRTHSKNHGADSIVITAETPSSAPVNLASEVARDRAIVVAVGTVGMELDRKRYYEKEIDFRVSRSYGPGRYDAAFEQKGRDYPIGYVRWSETRNMEAFLQLIADGKMNLQPLISHRFAIENAIAAYDLISGKTNQPHLAVLLNYSANEKNESRRLELVARSSRSCGNDVIRVGLLGAGNFATEVLIPAMKRISGVQFAGVCAGSGVRAHSAARKCCFEFCTTDEEQVFLDESINTVVIASRHHMHAAQVLRALDSGKNVFCEKPLCLNEEELEAIQEAYSRTTKQTLAVGFNRRFAPLAQRMKTFLSRAAGPLTMTYRVNAGPLPPDHWINDSEVGGGRILGEMCHFVDFLSFLCGALPTSVSAQCVHAVSGQDITTTLRFENGSVGTIIYACNGDRAFSKERIEVMGGGCVAVLEDFRRLELARHGSKRAVRSWFAQDKGHKAELRAFAECVRSGSPFPVSFDEIVNSTRTTIRIADSLRSGRQVNISKPEQSSIATPLIS